MNISKKTASKLFIEIPQKVRQLFRAYLILDLTKDINQNNK